MNISEKVKKIKNSPIYRETMEAKQRIRKAIYISVVIGLIEAALLIIFQDSYFMLLIAVNFAIGIIYVFLLSRHGDIAEELWHYLDKRPQYTKLHSELFIIYGFKRSMYNRSGKIMKLMEKRGIIDEFILERARELDIIRGIGLVLIFVSSSILFLGCCVYMAIDAGLF